MADFMYLLWYKDGDSRLDNSSPEQIQKVMQKWMAFMGNLKTAGHLKDGGAALEMGGKVVHGKKQVVTDGPYAEAKDIVGGYIIVTAKDLNEAVKLADGCPILDVEGMVEVRPVRNMS